MNISNAKQIQFPGKKACMNLNGSSEVGHSSARLHSNRNRILSLVFACFCALMTVRTMASRRTMGETGNLASHNLHAPITSSI